MALMGSNLFAVLPFFNGVTKMWNARTRVMSIVFALLAVALVLPAGCTQRTPSATVPVEYVAGYIPVAPLITQPQVEMASPLPQFPPRATVYRINYPAVDAAHAVEMAKKFAVAGEVREGDDMFTVTDNATGNVVEVLKTGSINYSLEASAYSKLLLNDEAQLPSTQEAEDIAIRFLEEKNLLPPEVKPFIETGVDGLSLHRVRVDFRYKIGEYRGEGPGYRYSVLVGDRGKIAGASVFYPQLETYAEVDLRSPEEALADVMKGKGSWMQFQGVRAVLDRVSLRYYLQPVLGRQEYVLPVFVFEGQGMAADGSASGTVAVIATAVKSK